MAMGGGIPGRDRGAVPHEIHNDPASGVIELKGEARHLWKATEELKAALRHQAEDFNARLRAQGEEFRNTLNLQNQDQSKFRIEAWDRIRHLEIWRAAIGGGFALFTVLLIVVWRFAGSAAEAEVKAVVAKQSAEDKKAYESLRETIQTQMIRLEEMEKLRKEATAAQRADGGKVRR